MHRWLTRNLKRWGATLGVITYALGVLGPAVAFAHADRASVEHVLSESHGGMLTLHFHDDDSDRHDHPAKPGSGPAHHCCGLVSLPGLAPSAAAAILAPRATTAPLPCSEPPHAGCGGGRLERPPKGS